MSKKNINLFCFIINLVLILSDDFDKLNRFDNYLGYFDCKKFNNSEPNPKIKTAEDCFEESPVRKWKCCYFEYIDDNNTFHYGCMRVRKNNITDLNDLKYFVSKLSTETVFNCKQNYIMYSFGISFALLLFLI